MKKLLGLLSVFTLFGSVSLAANLTVNTSTTLQTNCNGGSRSESYYLGKTPTRYFYDILGGDTDKYYVVGFSSSYANIYNPFGALQFQNG